MVLLFGAHKIPRIATNLHTDLLKKSHGQFFYEANCPFRQHSKFSLCLKYFTSGLLERNSPQVWKRKKEGTCGTQRQGQQLWSSGTWLDSGAPGLCENWVNPNTPGPQRMRVRIIASRNMVSWGPPGRGTCLSSPSGRTLLSKHLKK